MMVLGLLGTASEAAQVEYTGVLQDGDRPAEGRHQLRLTPYAQAQGGMALAGAIVVPAVAVTEGRFGVLIEVDDALAARGSFWFEVEVAGADGRFEPLAARESVAPKATTAACWDTAGNTLAGGEFVGSLNDMPLELRQNNQPALRIGTGLNTPVDGANISLGTNQTVISATGAFVAGGGNKVDTAAFATVGGGLNNRAEPLGGQPNFAAIGGGYNNVAGNSATTVGGGENNTASGNTSTIAGGGSNLASAPGSTVGGGVSHVASGLASTVGGGESNKATSSHATVGGGYNNRVESVSAQTDYATIGGGSDNSAAGVFTTIAGGKGNGAALQGSTVGGGEANKASGQYATVGGGKDNVADGDYNTIAGGLGNSALGFRSSIGGGVSNSVTLSGGTIAGGFLNESSYFSTVAGGERNKASGGHATVGGGERNLAQGNKATIPGGIENVASGYNSFAAGAFARATRDGMFTWASETKPNNSPFDPMDDSIQAGGVANGWMVGENTFNVYAPGGYFFVTGINSNVANGPYLTSGANAWSIGSSRTLKSEFQPIDAAAILDRVLALPITTWRYNSEPDGIRHMGAMAEDFSEAFGLGPDNRSINSVDGDGVALAAIQGLNVRLREELAARDAELARVRALHEHLSERLAQLERTRQADVAQDR